MSTPPTPARAVEGIEDVKGASQPKASASRPAQPEGAPNRPRKWCDEITDVKQRTPRRGSIATTMSIHYHDESAEVFNEAKDSSPWAAEAQGVKDPYP